MKAARRALGLAVFVALPAACAVYKDDILPSELEEGMAGSVTSAGSPSVGSSGASANGGSAAGSSSAGGTSGAGGNAGSGGTASEGPGGETGAGGEDSAGGDGSGGEGSGGHAGGMGGKGGAGGAGGKGGQGGVGGQGGSGHAGGGQGGGGQGGNGQGGGGQAGTGGKPGGPVCDDHPLSALASWVPTASHQGVGKDLIKNLTDNKTTRWSTSKPQAGDEWLQIDFGTTVSITHVNLQQAEENKNDYPRKYAVIVSDTPNDLSGTVRVMGSGVAGVSTSISLPAIATGRYLLIKQTTTSLSWWSAEEIEVTCVDP